jgi:DNA-binding response OmpR family regulator
MLPVMLLSSGAGNGDEGKGVAPKLSDALMQAGFEVQQGWNLQDLRSALCAKGPHLVVIDVVAQSDVDALALTSTIRANFQVGIILFIGCGSEDAICGLDSGADFCLARSASSAMLIATLNALSRRVLAQTSRSQPALPPA